MIELTTDMEVFKFNLSSHESEQKFKDAMINLAIDGSTKLVLVKFRKINSSEVMRSVRFSPAIVRRINVQNKRFFEDGEHYSIQSIEVGTKESAGCK